MVSPDKMQRKMKRREFLLKSGLLAGMSMLSGRQLLASILFAEGKMYPIRDRVGYYVERGGTIGWYLTEDHIVVVDTQFPEQARHFIARLRETNDQPIDLLLNTHHHFDHTAGNIAFKGIVQQHVAHENARANQERVARERGNLDEQLLPATTFSDTWQTKVGDETISLYYFGPAHTNGDAIIHFEKADVVHMGDLVFNRRYPYIDKTAGASIENWVKVLKKARKTFGAQATYIFGHAGKDWPVRGTDADLMAFENYLKRLLDYVQAAHRKGMTLDELKQQTRAIPGAPEWKGRGIERSLEAAWLEIVEGK